MSESAKDWREWVRFAMSDVPSPPANITDTDLRELVCQRWDRVAADRAVLLAALKELLHASPSSGWEQRNARKLAAAAIAKAEAE